MASRHTANFAFSLPQTKVIVLTMYAEEYVLRALQAGRYAATCSSAPQPSASLLAIPTRVEQGDFYLGFRDLPRGHRAGFLSVPGLLPEEASTPSPERERQISS